MHMTLSRLPLSNLNRRRRIWLPTVPPAIAAKVKAALNILIESYNVADMAYLSYHGAALAGTATLADQAALQTKLNAVSMQ